MIYGTMQGSKGKVSYKGTTNSVPPVRIKGPTRIFEIIVTGTEQLHIFEIDENRKITTIYRKSC